MWRKFITTLTVLISGISILIITGMPDAVNWWELTCPWLFIFFVSMIIGVTVNNLNVIRRYTYPALVVILAWGHEHRLLSTQFSYHANSIYHRHGSSYNNLYVLTQNLYDQLMFD